MDGMTEPEAKQFNKVLKRLKNTAPGETICLTYNDVALILKFYYIVCEELISNLVAALPKFDKQQKGDKEQ